MKALVLYALVEQRVMLPKKESGSLYLMAGDQLVIDVELAKEMEVLNKPNLFRKDSEVEVKGPNLRGGKYEINKGKAIPVKQENASPGDSALKEVSSDKSMESKASVKTKG